MINTISLTIDPPIGIDGFKFDSLLSGSTAPSNAKLWMHGVIESFKARLVSRNSNDDVGVTTRSPLDAPVPLVFDEENLDPASALNGADPWDSDEYQELVESIKRAITSFNPQDTSTRSTIYGSARDALLFVQVIAPKVGYPTAAPSDDGDIVFLWSREAKRAEVRFSGSNEVGYTMLRNGVFVPGGREASASMFPDDLRDYLTL